MEEVESLLSSIYTDMLMLIDGTWEPDNNSCQATIENIEKLSEKLGVNLKDFRK